MAGVYLDNDMVIKMKQCPCCGSQNTHIEKTSAPTETTGYFVECYNCGLRTAAWATGEIAVKYWDRRP